MELRLIWTIVQRWAWVKIMLNNLAYNRNRYRFLLPQA